MPVRTRFEFVVRNTGVKQTLRPPVYTPPVPIIPALVDSGSTQPSCQIRRVAHNVALIRCRISGSGLISLVVKRVPQSPYPKIVARNLRLLRASRGWSQEFVAFELEIHRSYLSGLENGSHNPTIDQLARFEGLFGIQVADLLNPELFLRTPWSVHVSVLPPTQNVGDNGCHLACPAKGQSQSTP
ncbi:MAG: helix-turn-helix transcriptional regulator [Hyphomicrobiales bacterium]|nr:helix-turn-helix transcriptional regulator [Hyphomicrobiales bacterium]